MKPIFDEETVKYLGYRKYWPELKDWVMAMAGVLLVCLILGGTMYYFLAPREKIKAEQWKATLSEWCATTYIKTLSEARQCASLIGK